MTRTPNPVTRANAGGAHQWPMRTRSAARVAQFCRSAAPVSFMKIKIALAALAGLVVGVVAMWFLVARTTGQVFTNLYLSGVMDQANVALHIRAGKQMTLLTNIEAALPTYVLAVDQEFRGDAGSTNALWMVKAYYVRNGIPIPPAISGILDALPPKPPTSCQIRLQALDNASTTNSTKSGEGK